MTENRYGPRPELGSLTPGQQVVIYRSYNDQHGRKPEERVIPAEVVKAARVWITLKPTEERFRFEWRMRRDSQDEGTKYSGSNASFATMEQHAWDEARLWAQGFLRESGISVRGSGPWDGREVELADIIARARR